MNVEPIQIIFGLMTAMGGLGAYIWKGQDNKIKTIETQMAGKVDKEDYRIDMKEVKDGQTEMRADIKEILRYSREGGRGEG